QRPAKAMILECVAVGQQVLTPTTPSHRNRNSVLTSMSTVSNVDQAANEHQPPQTVCVSGVRMLFENSIVCHLFLCLSYPNEGWGGHAGWWGSITSYHCK